MNEPAFEGASPAPSPAPSPSPVAPPRRRSRWPLRLLVLMVLIVAGVAAVALLVDAMHFAAPVHVTIDGEEVFSGFDAATLPPAHKLVLAIVIVVSVLSALLIVPVALLLALAAVFGAVLLAVGLPVIAVLTGLALLLSPLILLGWLLWKVLAS